VNEDDRKQLWVVAIVEVIQDMHKSCRIQVSKLPPLGYPTQALVYKLDGTGYLGPPRKRWRGQTNLTSKRFSGLNLDKKKKKKKRRVRIWIGFNWIRIRI
jgi:hypothetical protein